MPLACRLTVLYVLMRLTVNPAAARLSCRSVDAFTLAGYSTTSVPPGKWGSSLPITLPRACTAHGSSTQQKQGWCVAASAHLSLWVQPSPQVSLRAGLQVVGRLLTFLVTLKAPKHMHVGWGVMATSCCSCPLLCLHGTYYYRPHLGGGEGWWKASCLKHLPCA